MMEIRPKTAFSGIRPGVVGVVLFTAAYLLPATAVAVWQMNTEFMFYVAVMFILAAVMTMPETNVGGYVNTGFDLVANMVGVSTACVLIWISARLRRPLV